MTHDSPRTAAEIERWLAALVGQLLRIPPASIDMTARLERYGLDSVAAIGVTAELESYLGRELEPTLLYDFPTIRQLANHLTGAGTEKAQRP